MRRVLVFAVLLLGLAVAVDRERASSEAAERPQGGELDWVMVFSTAVGHVPATPLSSQALSSIHFRRNRFQGRPLGTRSPLTSNTMIGLVAAAFDPRGELLGSDSYGLGGTPGETSRLSLWCAGLAPGSLLVIARRGSLSARGPDAAMEKVRIETLFDSLGAQARPWESDSLSWAYITRRNANGWTPVIEASSSTRGVMLSAPVSPDDRSGPATASADSREGLTLLYRDIEKHRVVYGVPQKDLSVDSYVLPQGVSSELTWTDLEIPPGSRFSALLSANAGSRLVSKGVTFELLLDGVSLGRIEARTPAHQNPSWLDWEIHLPDGAGPRELKLIATPLPGSKAALPQVGAPLLSFGA